MPGQVVLSRGRLGVPACRPQGRALRRAGAAGGARAAIGARPGREGRFGRLWRLRGPLDRARDHERPHHGGGRGRGRRLTIYAGTAGGGVWKSVDGGLVFKPVFDKYNQSIGAIAIDPSNAEDDVGGNRRDVAAQQRLGGRRHLPSTDGGDLDEARPRRTERIARIVVHPKDGNVFVCATGHLFDDHPERGVYRTKDAGKTWEKALRRAGRRVRGPGDRSAGSGRPLRGHVAAPPATVVLHLGRAEERLLCSRDGGATWLPMKKGFPAGELGRIALRSRRRSPQPSTRRSRRKRARSTVRTTAVTLALDDRLDGCRPGRSTSRGCSSIRPTPSASTRWADRVGERRRREDVQPAWAAAGIRAPATTATCTTSGSTRRTRRSSSSALTAASTCRTTAGARCRFVGSLPVGQFYHVSYDMAWPYNVYGGLQDNSSWNGPSRRSGGIPNRDWRSLTGGDGFWAFADPSDPDIVYDEFQGGNLFRFRKSTLESKDIKPTPKAGEPKYRFNWNTPIHLSPTDPGTHLLRRAVPVPLERQGRVVGADLTRPDDQRSGEAEAGRVRRADARQFHGRESLHHLRHRRVAEEPQRHLGRDRRRQPPGDARRRPDVDERRRQRARASEEHLGERRGRARSPRAPLTPRSTAT